MSSERKRRPPLNFRGPYNVARSEFPNYVGEIWTEVKSPLKLTLEEFFKVRTDVVAALSRHGIVQPDSDETSDHDFYVYDDKFFDRTQKIELNTTERLPRILVPSVIDLQRVLKRHRLWRVMFIGEGHDDLAMQQFFVVYPDDLRIRQLTKGETASGALIANAKLRLAHQQERKTHQARRVEELGSAIRRAFVRMDNGSKEIVLAAWFDTLSGLDWDWGWEGKPGTSVWLLIRRASDSEIEDVLPSETSCSIRYATPDGHVIKEYEGVAADARMLVHFEDNSAVQTELTFRLDGRKYRFARSEIG